MQRDINENRHLLWIDRGKACLEIFGWNCPKSNHRDICISPHAQNPKPYGDEDNESNEGHKGHLILWSPSPLVPWSSGPLVLWSSGPLVVWSLGPLVFGCGSWKVTNTARSWQEAACGAFEKEGLMQMTTFAIFELLRRLSMTAF